MTEPNRQSGENEERIIEIEIERLRPFKEHPFQVKDATLVTSYKNWQSMGRQVMKGEKGITIIAPAPYKKMKEKEILDENQRPIMGTDGKPKTEQVEVTVPHFKAVTVFDIAQTSGEPIQTLAPDGTHEIAGYLQFESWGDIKDWLENTIAEGTDISERVDRALSKKMELQSMQKIINVSILADYMKMKSWMICMPYSTIIHRQIIKHILCRSVMLSLQIVVGICRHITWIDLDLQNFQTLQHKEKKYSILSRK